MHIDRITALKRKAEQKNEVHQPIDPLEKLQADFGKRFGRPDAALYSHCAEGGK